LAIGSDKRLITALAVIRDLDIEDDILLRQLEEGIGFLPNLKLRLLTQKDREAYEKNNPHYKMDDYNEKTPIIELRDTTLNEVIADPFNHIDLTILALKLLNPGNPYIDGKYATPSEELVPYQDWTPIGKIYGQQYTWNMGYSLHSKDVGKLQDLVKKLSQVDFTREQWYAIACERFDQSFHNRLPPDRVIDYCIAFEALFMRGEYPKDRLSMGQTIGIGCSMLLGNNNEEREVIAANLEQIFALRNKVVHGKAFNYSEPDYEKRVSIEDYLRKSIVKLMPS